MIPKKNHVTPYKSKDNRKACLFYRIKFAFSYICIYLETPLSRFVIFTSDEAKFSKIQIFSQFWQTICLEYVLQSNFWLCPTSIHCFGRVSDLQNLHLQCYRQTLDLWLALLRMQPFHDVRKSHIRSMLSCCMFFPQVYSSPFYTTSNVPSNMIIGSLDHFNNQRVWDTQTCCAWLHPHGAWPCIVRLGKKEDSREWWTSLPWVGN